MSLKKEIVKALKNEDLDAGHGLDHLIRVQNNGNKISHVMKLNKNILTAALLLHDCDRSDEENHALKSSQKAKKILTKLNFPKEQINIVFNAIKNHSRTDLSKSLKDIYSIIIYDADKLDGIGNQAIKRVIEIKKKKKWNQEQATKWYLGRILDVVKNEPLYLQQSKKIAKNKLKQSLAWCKKNLKEKFNQEINKYGFTNIQQIKF
ncbi:MAG TPA: HD domain-containing protein [archaeon]|nr:HD domain-containing protein [archaeon]